MTQNDSISYISAKYDVKYKYAGDNLSDPVSDQIYIFFSADGRQLVTLNQSDFILYPGQIIIIQKMTPSSIKTLDPNSKYAFIQFNPHIFDIYKLIPHLLTDVGYWFVNAGKTHDNHFMLNEKQSQKLAELVDKYENHSGFTVDFLRFSTFTEIICHIAICIKKQSSFKQGKQSEKSLSDVAQKYIDINFNNDIHLSDIADYLHITEQYLCNIFKKQTGFTIKQYINTLRIEKAKLVLRDSAKKPLEAYEATGFNDYHTYLRMFKKLTGVTPTQYQAKVKKTREAYPSQLLHKLSDHLPED